MFLGEWKHKKNLRWKVQEKQENSKMVELMLSFSKYTKHVHWTRGLGISNWFSYVLLNFWTSSEFSAIMYLAEMLSMLLICVYAFSKPEASKPFLSCYSFLAAPQSLIKAKCMSYSPTGFLQDLRPSGAWGWKEGPETAGWPPGLLRPDRWTPSWSSHTFQLGPGQSLQEFLLFSI